MLLHPAKGLVVLVQQAPEGLLVAFRGLHQLVEGFCADGEGHSSNVLHEVGVDGKEHVDVVSIGKELHITAISPKLGVEVQDSGGKLLLLGEQQLVVVDGENAAALVHQVGGGQEGGRDEVRVLVRVYICHLLEFLRRLLRCGSLVQQEGHKDGIPANLQQQLLGKECLCLQVRSRFLQKEVYVLLQVGADNGAHGKKQEGNQQGHGNEDAGAVEDDDFEPKGPGLPAVHFPPPRRSIARNGAVGKASTGRVK